MTHTSSIVGSNEILRDLPYLGKSIEVDDGELEDLTPGEGEEGEQGFVSTVRLRFGEILLGDVGDQVSGRGFGVERELAKSGSMEREGEKGEMVKEVSSSSNTRPSDRSSSAFRWLLRGKQ